ETVAIGHGDRGHPELGRAVRELLGGAGPVLQREIGARIEVDERGEAHRGTSSVPQPFHVPAVALPVEVEIPDRAAARLDAPIFAIAAVVPPPALDPPLSDHIADLVPAPPPFAGRRQPTVALDPALL